MEKIKESLLNKGIIYFSGEFSKDNIDDVVEAILYLNDKSNIKEITLIINSVGGLVGDAFGLIDVMEMSKKKIRTIGTGYVASCGLLAFMAGDERLISDKAMILSHQYSGGKEGKYHELVGSRKFEDYLNDRIVKHYQRHTKLSKKIINEKLLCATNTWLTPAESLKYNLADKIVNTF
jgi:ATP-dependent Clp protease protease subunit